MKKRLFLIAAAALALVACAKEEAYEPEVVVSHKGVKVTIGASFEDLTNGTKSDYTAGGDFYWSTGDAIWIGSDEASGMYNWGHGSIITNQTNKGPGYATADFDCVLSGGTTTAVAAVFPYESVTPSYTAGNPLGTLSLELKKTISWANSSGLSDDLKKEIYDRNKGLETTDPKYVSDIKFMQADNVMVARYEDIYAEGYPQGTTTGLQFYNVGGVFCLTLNNIPPGAEKLVFTTDKKITGTFPVSNVEVNSNNYPQIDTEATETEAEKSVTIEFETITSSLNTRVFFIPVPVGSYVIGFDTQDHDGNSLWKFSAARANTVERGHIVKMPALTHVVVSGGGDSATNIITTPTGCNETVYLPSTESNIYVRMNQTGGTITLAYSTIEGAKHPANVYLEALGDIENLNINLPDSHVELKGSGSVAQVITNVTSYTSYATLKVESTIKIGKDSEVNSGLTVTGGSLDLQAPTQKVTINIPPDAANTTENKVQINITSTIKALAVERAAYTDKAADKIYVKLAPPVSDTPTAITVEGINVDEKNCNLWVANGVTVTSVQTQGANTTIEGSVETLSASGEGTTVVVEKSGSVTESITSSNNATIVIEERNQTEIDNNEAGEITGNQTTNDGTITTIDAGSVAIIDSNKYATLNEAVSAASDGATITIIKEGQYTIPAIAKTLTIVGGVEGVEVNHAGQSAVTTITSGKTLTLKNIALNLDKSFYQGFGTSSTGANAGALVMENCSIDGSLSLFGVSTFTNCTFTAKNANAGYYNIWAVYSNATFTGCSFTNTNRAVNVYDPACGQTRKTVTFTNCSFTASEKKKAAINIHHNPAPVQASGAKFDVVTTDCTTSGTWASSVEDTGEPANATVCNSALWMVSDIENWTNGGITVNGVNVYDAPVAQIGTTTYATLEAAVAAAEDGQTITLLSNSTGNGIKVPQGKYTSGLTIDFNNHSYTVDGTTVGSAGTETNGFQLLKDNVITLKNGTITSAKAKILVQNYSNLTLKGMTLSLNNAGYSSAYTLSNNNGEIVIDGSTITANQAGGYAFDVCRYSTYPSVSVTVKEGSTINGNIEVDASNGNAMDGFNLMLEAAINGNISLTANAKAAMASTPEKAVIKKKTSVTQAAPEGYSWKDNGDGTNTLTANVAQIGTTPYATLEAAVAAAEDGQTITLLSNSTGNGIKVPQGKYTSGLTIDFNNHSYTVDGTTVGSAGTETNGFQLLKDNVITLKNGTITSTKAKILVQNYSNLTLKGMTLSLNNAGYSSAYTLSNNNGEIVIDGSTITANPAGGYAFDVCRYSTYPSVSVTVKEGSTINGNIEVDASNGNAMDGFNLMLEVAINGSISLTANAKAAMASTPEKAVIKKKTSVAQDAPEGYNWKDNGDGTNTLTANVAQIGTTTYATLEAAFAAVTTEAATTITLLSDVTITENNIVVGGTHGATASVTASVNPVNITFDLNNHNITGTKTIYLVGGSLNITGTGTIETTNKNVAAVGVLYVKSTGGLDYTSKRTLTIGQNVTLKGAKYGLNVFGTNEGTVANNIEVNVNGTIKGDLFVLGNLSNQSNTIDINVNGTIDASAVDMNGIALNGYANVTVGANAVVKGNTGIEVRAGRLVVNGGEITATSEFSIASNGSGTSTKGAAVAVSQHTTNLPCSAIISGGTFTGAYALYEKDVEIAPSDNITLSVTDGTFNGNIYSEDFTHFISGGIFSVDPTAYVAAGYAATQSENVYIVGPAPVADYVFEDDVVTVYTAEGLSYVSLHYADFRDSEHNLSIKLEADLNMTGKEFSSFDVNNYTSSDKEIKLFTFDGQNHTLSGMTGMLISKSWAGHSAMDVKNLTIANSTIEQDVNDINDNVGVGAICGNAEASRYLRITNVHLSNSTVRGGHWTGGLVGIAGGYDNANDGPVLEKIYVTNCSVEGCTIEGKGSNGALVGHAAYNPATLWEVENFRVLNNSINNTGGKTDRTGALIGTLGDINRASSAFPEEKNLIWFTSPLVVTGNSVLGVANDAKKVGRLGTEGSPVYLDNVNVIANWL